MKNAILAGIVGGLVGTAASALFSDMLIPSKLANTDQMREHIKNMQEAEKYLQEAKELNRELDELCRRTGGCDYDPCN